MDMYSPEFKAYWQAGDEQAAQGRGVVDGSESLSDSQQVALEELVERVSAARSVV